MLEDVVTMYTMHVVRIQIEYVKSLVKFECVMEPAKTMLNAEQQFLTKFSFPVRRLESVCHNMLNTA